MLAATAIGDIVSPTPSSTSCARSSISSCCASLRFRRRSRPRTVRNPATVVAVGWEADNPMFREAPAAAQAAVTYILMRVRVNAVTALSLFVLMVIRRVDDALLPAVL